MCGIFGYQIRPGEVSSGRRLLLASDLARSNDDRGGHSWGAALLDGAAPEIQKGLGDFVDACDVLAGASAFFGHTRWATHGEKTVANAHPFEIGKVVGAHNGIIDNHDALNLAHSRAFPVDSMHIFAHIDEGLPLGDLKGYGSVVWIERDDTGGEIYLCKMRGGELSIAGIGEHPDPVGVVWSSDKDHLKEAFRNAGIKDWFTYEIETGKVYVVLGGMLWSSDRTLDLGERESRLTWQNHSGSMSSLVGLHSDDDWDDFAGKKSSGLPDASLGLMCAGADTGDWYYDEAAERIEFDDGGDISIWDDQAMRQAFGNDVESVFDQCMVYVEKADDDQFAEWARANEGAKQLVNGKA